MDKLRGPAVMRPRLPRVQDTSQLVGVAEIAAVLRVPKQTVWNWKSRDASFPPPLQKLRMGPVWRLGPIMRWYSLRSRSTQSKTAPGESI
jgi:hypothetical protein